MPAVSHTFRASYPVAQVWNLLTDPQNFAQWDQQLVSVEAMGHGAGQRIDLSYPDKVLAAYVAHYDPLHQYAYQYNHRAITWEVRYDFEAHGQQTVVTRSHRAKGLAGWLVWYAIREKLRATEQTLIVNLKRFLESTPL